MTPIKFGRIAAVALVLMGVAACSDDLTSPVTNRPVDPDVQSAIDAPAAAPVRAPRASISASVAGASDPADTLRVSFQVGPEGGVFPLGRHWIAFPANSVCDMSQAQYGEEHWNELCPIAAEPVTISAKVFADSVGRPLVEFAEHLRFDPTKQVILHMSFDYRAGDDAPDIFWKKSLDAAVVNEGELDPAMVTLEGDTWMVYRRVKHFSTYTVSTGFLSLRAELDMELRRSSVMPTVSSLNSGHVVATGRYTKEER